MTTYLTPGVYVEEIPSGARVIEGVGTSTAGLVGTTPRLDAHLHEPVLVLNWLHFRREFVDGADGRPAGPSTDLTRAVFGFFQNGGTLCYVVNVGAVQGPVPGGTGTREGVDALDLVDQVSIVAAPGFSDPVSHDRLLTHCETRKNRVAVLDGPCDFPDVLSLTRVGTAAPDETPDPSAASAPEPAADGEPMDGRADEEASSRPPPPQSPAEQGFRPRLSERGFGAFYVPWLDVTDPIEGGGLVPCPPSGHVAGIWARTDAQHGVHKAPANTVVRGATRLRATITAAEQGILNPEGVNCLRFFPGQGNLVWGARTVGESSSDMKYVNVRRLFCFIQESILLSTQWTVFQPNGLRLWKSIERDCTDFLTRLWRDGALAGSTAEEAFFVKCDAETTPPMVQDAGQVVIQVGVAPLKPAEFVVFMVSQIRAGASGVTEDGA